VLIEAMYPLHATAFGNFEHNAKTFVQELGKISQSTNYQIVCVPLRELVVIFAPKMLAHHAPYQIAVFVSRCPQQLLEFVI